MTNNIKQTTNNKGFTLIEIMVAIGIVLILSGISWAGFIKYQPSLALSAIARSLTTDLRSVQQLAVTEQINHGIFFNISNNQYQLEKINAGTVILSVKNLPANVVFCGITGLFENRAEFNPYGSALYSGSVCLTNANGQTKIIDIKPSGFVKIQN
ncbi:MAG: prepilin-type N-terminal cleavage/methylation domain-containing protein [Candidatus Pacebacteria bacterium]|nr:prepilin-type N-terminal cleavage/methylation domain-containing protein [Candidatus Paceibacterota bacterium]